MILFPSGINITQAEYSCLLHVEIDPEKWLLDAITEKARLRREALINEWRPKLFADSGITELPATEEGLVRLIMSRSDYRSRVQADAEQNPLVLPYRHNVDRFNGDIRRGVARVPSDATVLLFPSGLDVPAMDADCILAYVQDLDDWVLGALLGHINRGRKKMIREYQPVLMADLSVTTFPANEEGLIEVITSRSDYQTLRG